MNTTFTMCTLINLNGISAIACFKKKYFLSRDINFTVVN